MAVWLQHRISPFGTVHLADQLWLLDQVVRPDGKIIVLGVGYADRFSGGYTTDVYQFNADGSPDGSFGTNGLLRLNDRSSYDPYSFTKLSTLGDGSVLLTTGSSSGFQVAKVLADGALDANFGISGVATITMPFQNFAGRTTLSAVSTMSDGDILIAGGYLASQSGTGSGQTVPVVVRLMPNGQADPNWGTNGVLDLASLGGTEPGSGLRNERIGDMLVTKTGVLLRFPDSILKVTNGGEIDQTFGAAGWLATASKFSVLHADHSGTLLAELSDGRIVFTGDLATPNPNDFIATVTVASATGDGVADIVRVSNTNRITIIDGATQKVLVSDYQPYEDGYVGGLSLATGDLDGDGDEDIAVCAQEGGSARVIVLRPNLTGTAPTLEVVTTFFGIAD